MKRKYKKYEERVRKKLEIWLNKQRHPRWSISREPIKKEKFPIAKISEKETLFETYWLSPDIDVLAYCKRFDKLISYEVKGPKYKPKKYVSAKKGKEVISLDAYRDRKAVDFYKNQGYEIEKPVQPHYPDLGIIYEGMGQALFNLRYVDQSFLVLPHFDYLSHHSHPIFLNILVDRHLPVGLIDYDYFFPSDDILEIRGFKIIRQAKNSSLWSHYGRSLQRHKLQIDLLHERKIRTRLKEKLEKHEI